MFSASYVVVFFMFNDLWLILVKLLTIIVMRYTGMSILGNVLIVIR